MNFIEEIGNMLKQIGSKISTAESCTAGYVSNTLTSIQGSSDFFEGSLIVYSNKAKINVLGVESSLIDEHTEVSEQVAKRMAKRVKEVMNTDYSIATTGYADVKGFGTEENPPGTIYIAVSTPDKTITKKLQLKDSRSRNVYLATNEALEILREHLRSLQVV
jgi:PncC family amidohydrolase